MFFTKFHDARKRRRSRREDGNDLIITLFFLPIILGVALSLVDLSMYFQTKTEIQQITRDVARTGAKFGGAGYTAPVFAEKVPGANASDNLSAILMSRLYDSSTGSCIPSFCVNRTVEVQQAGGSPFWGAINSSATYDVGGAGVSPVAPNTSPTLKTDFKVWTQCTPCLTTAIGEHITCSVVYNYGGVGGPLALVLGFGSIVNIPIEVSETFQTETQYTGYAAAEENNCGQTSLTSS